MTFRPRGDIQTITEQTAEKYSHTQFDLESPEEVVGRNWRQSICADGLTAFSELKTQSALCNTVGAVLTAGRQNRGTITEAMAEQITIPISTFEITISYARPVLSLWLDRASIVQRMFDVFKPWNLTVDDIEAITTGKPSEQGIKFIIPLQKITFFFGPASCKFKKEAANWSDADEVLRLLGLALEVLLQGGVELGKKSTSLALHLQPKSVTFSELLRPFLVPALSNLEKSPSEAMAYVVRWKSRRITLDGSAALANAVFLHMERDFDAAVSFEEIKATIFQDEAAMFAVLGVEESES